MKKAKIRENVKTIRENKWVSICVAILAIAAVVVTVLLVNGEAEAPPAETGAPVSAAEETVPAAEAAETEAPPAATPPARETIPAGPGESAEPTELPAITPPAASASPVSSSDVILHPVDPPSGINLR